MKLFSRFLSSDDSASCQKHVVILHGLFAASDNLLRLGKELSAEYCVHMLDLRNHGASPHASEMNYQVMAGDVLAYMAEQKVETFALVGHSMGGKVAMQLALSAPDKVLGLVVADIAPVRYEPSHQQILAGVRAVADHPVRSRKEADVILQQYVDSLGVRQFLIKNLQRQESRDGLAWRFNLSAIEQSYSNIIEAPQGLCYDGAILFIAGELSDYILPSYRTQTLALFPRAQLKFIPKTTHWLHAEKPEVFNAMCQRFLKTLFNSH